MLKEGYSILLLGAPHSGKTPFARRLVEKNNLGRLVADVRREYPITYKRRFIDSVNDMDDFVYEAERTKDSNVLFEEATAFFDGYNRRKLQLFVIGIEHNHCIGYFLYHEVKSIPYQLINKARYIILWDTGEPFSEFTNKDKRFARALRRLQYKIDNKIKTPVIIDTTDKSKQTLWHE